MVGERAMRLREYAAKLERAADTAQKGFEDPTAARLEEAQRFVQAISEEGVLELRDAMSSHLGRDVSFGELATLLTKQ